jgi:predicted dienelactone hydrolase
MEIGKGKSGQVPFHSTGVMAAMIRVLKLLLSAAGLLCATAAHAGPVGELHRVVPDDKAALRDAEHSANLRVTVWYPAAADSIETPLPAGPPGQPPMFDLGRAAPDAAFAADSGRRPVILLSHGFGGTARIMGWFGIVMARNGYLVLAVDHPGNNAVDRKTVAGAALWWNRADDLRIALDAMERDPAIGPHLDRTRVAAAGFSAGGFTTLVLAGARVDRAHFMAFCATHPTDGVCLPQREFAVSDQDAARTLQEPAVAAEVAHAGDDHAIPDLRAAFAMAPALVQALDPQSLMRMHTPIKIVLGDADTVAPPGTNGLIAAAAIPNAELERFPSVGHYDFVAPCTPAGQVAVPTCKVAVPQPETHDRAIAAALAFFARHLSAP